MQAIRSAILGSIVVLITGCLHTKSEQQEVYKLTTEDEKIVSDICFQVTQTGDLWALITRIKAHSREVLSLLSSKNVKSEEKRIAFLADEISSDTKKVQSLSRVEWNTPLYPREIVWKIDETDFPDLIAVRLKKFNITSVTIKELYVHGERRDDFMNQVKINEASGAYEVRYSNVATGLELCELDKTLVLVVEVQFRNLLIQDSRIFSLYIKQ